jgi:hypothetical protein
LSLPHNAKHTPSQTGSKAGGGDTCVFARTKACRQNPGGEKVDAEKSHRQETGEPKKAYGQASPQETDEKRPRRCFET